MFEQGVGQLAEPVLDDVLAGCSFRRRIAAIGSPLITMVLFHSGSRSVLDTTYLVMLLIRSL
jgi:hypothetical protein